MVTRREVPKGEGRKTLEFIGQNTNLGCSVTKLQTTLLGEVDAIVYTVAETVENPDPDADEDHRYRDSYLVEPLAIIVTPEMLADIEVHNDLETEPDWR